MTKRVLVKIDHWRCGEPSGTTLLWAPSDIDQMRLDADAAEAQKRERAAAEALYATGVSRQSAAFLWLAKTPDAPFLRKHWGLPEEKMQALWDEEQAAKRQAHQLQLAAHRSFADHMHDLGYGYFRDDDPPLTTEVDWGHAHGKNITYGSDVPDDHDTDDA